MRLRLLLLLLLLRLLLLLLLLLQLWFLGRVFCCLDTMLDPWGMLMPGGRDVV